MAAYEERKWKLPSAFAAFVCSIGRASVALDLHKLARLSERLASLATRE